MALIESKNPVLSEKTFQEASRAQYSESMTLNGTVGKMAFLLALVLASAVYSWGAFARGENVMPYMIGGAIGGLVLALVISFKKEWAAYLAPAYALAKGLLLGAVSAYYASRWDGIVLQAVGLTIATFIGMLVLYRARIIRATERFKSVMFAAVTGIAIFYLIAFVLGFFNISIPFLHEGSLIGIGFSVVVTAVAALMLIIDFDMIENGITQGAPKYFEWYASFALLVTLIWLYLEILRLVSKINSSR
ncbi:Bax inhibitor-1/YccA family protein [Chitinophaga sp.]|uniref:Bax inhibitor-1/YccA family protein n=1 Tax=Chitinophaga sp. TaxID=1869181 RepID=UPI0031DA017D